MLSFSIQQQLHSSLFFPTLYDKFSAINSHYIANIFFSFTFHILKANQSRATDIADRSRAKTETSIKSSNSKRLSLLFNGDPEIKSLAAAGEGGRRSERGRQKKGSKMGQCVWLLKGSPAGRGRGTGQPGGGSSSTLTQSRPFTRPVAQGSLWT